jgi:hypothetical protein
MGTSISDWLLVGGFKNLSKMSSELCYLKVLAFVLLMIVPREEQFVP